MKNQYSRLVKKARKNDEKAIRELYDLTIRKMTFIARKYLREDIDDVLQNSYVKAFKNLNQLKDTEKFDKWLGMIVARNCKNELVKRKDISFTDIEEDDYKFDESIENTYDEFKPDSEASYNELRDTILSILNELKPDQRMCIMMFYYQELSIKEISKALEVNENTVKSRKEENGRKDNGTRIKRIQDQKHCSNSFIDMGIKTRRIIFDTYRNWFCYICINRDRNFWNSIKDGRNFHES